MFAENIRGAETAVFNNMTISKWIIFQGVACRLRTWRRANVAALFLILSFTCWASAKACHAAKAHDIFFTATILHHHSTKDNQCQVFACNLRTISNTKNNLTRCRLSQNTYPLPWCVCCEQQIGRERECLSTLVWRKQSPNKSSSANKRHTCTCTHREHRADTSCWETRDSDTLLYYKTSASYAIGDSPMYASR